MTFEIKKKKDTFNYYFEIETAQAIVSISERTGLSKSEIVARILADNSAIKAEIKTMEALNDS
ncbi:MAG: hypothetical protein DRI57_09150 [Deltaproteobacteria bacterium]|nr:MAG: hypothetical protein DRI57_09150 [Deltaproteobacteria bacterium]